ncbi:carboxypeptidase S [Coniophora puteana RWD-64-598 SS2]|uniref:Carboxypeptidase S n=1 Tax=Coniophora puteana (strain RWD-64-598) TaxID=741705 RepID=A0A5M3MJ56_CONPW|nr:carboxypeptidase S [Coniophora puteana RWD-64-598 SS2]EIW79289.1 carboxypeptidase S [Coniophora puteana RWD-64-598 SS2]
MFRQQVPSHEDICPQVPALTPSNSTLLQLLDDVYSSDDFKLYAYESLGGSVRIPTVTYDDLGSPEEDHRWEIHSQLHDYLVSRFPLSHEVLQRTKVARYALVYKWQGTDDSLKPLVIAGHMDVVPVDPATEDEWIYPPFSGHYDGEWIWGRGSSDDKPNVIGSLTAIEALLEQAFQPTRTVLLAFGIDEERGGITGASAIGQYLLETFGENSLAMIVDEGGGYSDHAGTIFASPAVAEKGYVDVRVDVSTPGGHSSRPPRHTGIGILANLVTGLEENPHDARLVRERTYYQSLLCLVQYDRSTSPDLRALVYASQGSDAKLHELEAKLSETAPDYFAQAGTTQAVDLIGGGVKVNALPEAVWAIINHRIADYSSVLEVQEHFAGIIKPVAEKYNMSVDAFGREIRLDRDTTWGHIQLSEAFGSGLEPAPVTPTTNSEAYELLSGTILSTIRTNIRANTSRRTKDVIVSPALSLGRHIDTRHYWRLTRHIFRYGHRGSSDSYNGAHTVNEAVRGEGLIEQIRFYTQLILNANESDLD